MSLALNQTLTRLRPVAKTCMTVGLYMGFGDLLCQKIALKREKLYGMVLRITCREARRAFAFFTAGFTFSGLGNHFANTAAARLFPTSRFNDVLRRVLVLNLLFPITQSITFGSVMFCEGSPTELSHFPVRANASFIPSGALHCSLSKTIHFFHPRK